MQCLQYKNPLPGVAFKTIHESFIKFIGCYVCLFHLHDAIVPFRRLAEFPFWLFIWGRFLFKTKLFLLDVFLKWSSGSNFYLQLIGTFLTKKSNNILLILAILQASSEVSACVIHGLIAHNHACTNNTLPEVVGKDESIGESEVKIWRGLVVTSGIVSPNVVGFSDT